jgi:hypothetical protein
VVISRVSLQWLFHILFLLCLGPFVKSIILSRLLFGLVQIPFLLFLLHAQVSCSRIM